jgi:hypothetical protein
MYARCPCVVTAEVMCPPLFTPYPQPKYEKKVQLLDLHLKRYARPSQTSVRSPETQKLRSSVLELLPK